jgi:predicted dithiol-disulfide oxidoreductase (DUF899 family)
MQVSVPPTVSPQEWDAAREELLVVEKQLTRARDTLAAKRRRMPRMAVDKEYRFERPARTAGTRSSRARRSPTSSARRLHGG